MVIQSAEVTKDHVIVVLNELKATNGPLTLQGGYKPDALEAYLTDAQGHHHPISPETLSSLKPEIRSWLDGILPPNVQELLSERGAHVRLTAKQDDAALLWGLYQKIP
jgi:hypothetical protein